MKQFLLSRAPEMGPSGLEVRLDGDDYHYLVRVRRLKPGAVFKAVLPGGGPVLVRVVSVKDGVLAGEITPDRSPGGAEALSAGTPAPGARRILLFQALPRSPKMDLVIRQAAEAGVTEIVPFQSEYSVVRAASGGFSPDGGASAEGKIFRWRKIVREARQQSGSSTETRIRPLADLAAALAYWESVKAAALRPAALLMHPSGGGMFPLANPGFHGYLDMDPDITAAAVGPEGGFAPAELERFLSAGWKPVSLGDTVLRTETAALFAVAAIKIILLENQSWILKRTETAGPDTVRPDTVREQWNLV